MFDLFQGRSAKNNGQANTEEPEELKRAPHSFVIHRGNVGSSVIELTQDFRKVMEPFTASSLKVSGSPLNGMKFMFLWGSRGVIKFTCLPFSVRSFLSL